MLYYLNLFGNEGGRKSMNKKIFFWKKICLGAIIIISGLAIATVFTISAKGDSIELNFSFDEPEITEWDISNTTYNNVTMNETDIIGDTGVPMLPVKTLSILLPQKGIVVSINLTYSTNVSLGNSYNVTPGGLLTNLSEVNQPPYNESLFNSSRSYPTCLFEDFGIGYFRGYAILMCHLYPVHYINDTGEIYYYENMTLNITTNNSGSVSRFFRGLERDEIMMKQLVDDYSMKYTYNSTLPPPTNSTIVKYDQQWDFVIITRQNLVNKLPSEGIRDETWKTFWDLADYKNDYTDYKTKIVTVEEILSDPAYYNTSSEWGDGDHEIYNDTQCRIRNFIKHASVAWDADYFLLGGDIGEDLIPARKLWCKRPESTKVNKPDLLIPSDLYYACLNGSFNEDRDGKWGEPFDGYESGDFEDPPYRRNNGNGEEDNFYAEADVQQYKTDFEVGLLTPPLNLSGYDSVRLSFESNFHAVKDYQNYAKIKVYSKFLGDLYLEYSDFINSEPETKKRYLEPGNYNNPEEVYIEFYYKIDYDENKDDLNKENYSWNIDKVRINETDVPTPIFLFEDFEDPWVENSDGDLVPDYDWKQKMYGETEGKWTREHYREDVDLIGDVFVGRAPVGDIKEVSNFVFKTLKYEETSDRHHCIKKFLTISGVYTSGNTFEPYCEKVRAKIPSNYKLIEMKDTITKKDNGKYKRTFYPNWKLRFNLNRNYTHLIYNCEHGGVNGTYDFYCWRDLNNEWQYRSFKRFNTEDACDLINKNPFFWYSSSCLTGKFDVEDCLAEYLTVKSPHGAFAVIMDAELNWLGEEEKYLVDKKNIPEWFYDLMFNEVGGEGPYPIIGKAFQLSKNKFYRKVKSEKYDENFIRPNIFIQNLMGDPTVSIKSPKVNYIPYKPNPKDITYVKNSDGSYTFSVKTTDKEEDKISYQFRINYIRYTKWTKYYNSGDTASMKLSLQAEPIIVQARARDICSKWNNRTAWSNPKTVSVSFDSNIQTYSTTAVLGKQIQFSGLASEGTPPYGSWYYDFGDGNNSQQQNTTHTYNTLGSYNVTLNVTDSQNISSNCSIVINTVILNSDFESSPGPAVSNLQETFYFNDKSKGYYDIVNWSWDFGDGNTSYQKNTSHTYSSYGAYNVTLNVTDNQSNTDTYYQMIYIDSVSPILESVSSNFNIVGYGSNVTILVNTSDSSCGIKTVKVNITYPNSSYCNYTIDNNLGSIYEYVFSDCWQLGQYSYTVWVVDNANNTNCSTEKSFVVTRMYGYNKIGGSNQTIWDTITGSVFRVNEKGVADNISVYLDPGNATSDYHYNCVIYSHNDSELAGISEEKNISVVKGWHTFNFSVPKPVLLNDTDYVIGCWSNYSNITMYYDNGVGIEEYYDDGNCTLQGHYFEGVYSYAPDPICFDHEDRRYSIYCCYTPDNTTPEITNVSDSPSTVGFGFNVTIRADVSDNQSGVETVKVNITYPNSTQYSYNMNNVGNDTYEYVFNNSWNKGQYNYSIWAVDYMNHSNSSSGHSFSVSAQATISVCTIKDEYGTNETVNLTDPPAGSPGIGYELLDGGDVLHIWNQYDSYYFDTNSGIQLTNHYDEYWSHNVLMLGYYHNYVWKLIYRIDELSGFNKNIDTDNESYVNATIWKDLSYNSYDFRLAIRYHLGVDDNELTVIPYIKNLGQEIPYVLGFGWEMKDLQIDMTSGGDYINVNRSMYYLNQTLDNVYTDLSETEFYLMENITSTRTKSLYLKWNQSLTYKLQVKSREGQYNAPVTLFVRIGTLKEGQEKYTRMYWYDADQVSYYFNSYNTSEAWATHPESMVDGSISNYASTTSVGDVELCDGNNCSGADLGTISKVELRVCSYYTVYILDTFLRPVFGGTSDGDNIYYQTPYGPGRWSPWFDITNDPSAPQPWSWSDVKNLDCDVESSPGMPGFTLYCSGLEVRVTYAPTYPPEISDPYPSNGSTGVSICPVLNITVSDQNGDNMNITWFSNSSDSWVAFGTNNSVGNGTYHQTFSNASVNGKWWYWKVNVSDGMDYTESCVYKFYTGCQSKIVNTGSTNIKGYLLIQVQYYNETSESWVVADDTVNESSPRSINWDDPYSMEEPNLLALDTIFNGLVNTSNLSEFGNGTYRIYTAFRDPDGNILECDDETELVATYEFEVTFQ